jgi:hypothetical protein
MAYKVKRKKSKEQTELEAIRNIKGCYGTKEYSIKSGICESCRLKKDCKEVKNKQKSKTFINSQRIVIDKIGKKRSYRI